MAFDDVSLPFVVVAEFVLKANAQPTFLALIRRNAELSVMREDGCRRFDVLVDRQALPGDDRVVLYEIYDSPQAFEAHLGSEHFLSFRAQSAELIETSKVQTFHGWENQKVQAPEDR